MPSMNVSLTPELLHIVQSKVESGLYNNASEVVREAIRQLDTNAQLLHELKLGVLRKSLEPGLRQAEVEDYTEYSVEELIRGLNNSPAA